MKKIIKLGVISIFFVICCFAALAYAEELSNGVKMSANTEVTYYLTVEYDGKDLEGNVSDDTQTSDVKSGYIEVEDKLPDGLTYNGIVETGTGQITAVHKSDGSSCNGYVVGGTEGITYDPSTRIVSFKVKNLQAGCTLTVGITVTTPEDNGKRQDFYNTFQAVEDNYTDVSNQVHFFMGDKKAPLYEVNYIYVGTIPENAPNPPETMKYAEDAKVVVANNVNLTGYTFSGWTSSDVKVASDGSFIMPNFNVTLKGEFIVKPIYKVTYKITGDAPKNYSAPPEESYYENMNVEVDSLKAGDIIDGYIFQGWTTKNDITIDDGVFLMPDSSVEFVAQFERINYKVSYEFIGTNIPEDGDDLLPDDSTHYPKDKVTLVDPKDAEGYRFLGWYHKDNFEMPEKNVLIQGEWAVEAGVFEPTITKKIVNKKETYKQGDIVEYEIVVTNNESYDIRDVAIEEQNEKAEFVEGNDYKVVSSHLVKIATLPANSSVVIKAKYIVDKEDKGTIVNRVELIGALADDNNLLTEDEIFAEATFEVPITIDPNPNTNDDIMNYVTIGAVSILVIGGLGFIIYKFKLFSKKDKK